MANDVLARLSALLTLDAKGFKAGLNQAGKQAKGFSSVISRIGPMIAGAFSVAAVSNFIRSSGEAYDKQMKAEQKVEQAVKQTGGAAGYTAEELKKMASELQKVTRYGDEDILNKVTAQLLSFPKITGAVFKDAQKAVLDVATLLDGDIQSSAIAIGKALQDPVKGITAMRRMGIMFSEEQIEVVNTLVEQNKLYEAQELILKEINLQYGGQAEAAAKTGLGAIQQLKNAWGDFTEAWFGANLADKAGKQHWLSEGLDYMTWRMNKFREEGGGFTEWWKRFLKLGEYSEESYNFAQNAEKNANQIKKNAAILTGGSGGFKSYADMVNASAEANLKAAPTIEKTAEELKKESKAAEDAAKAYQKLLEETRKTAQGTGVSEMSSVSGGADMNIGAALQGKTQFNTESGLFPDSMVQRDVENMSTWSAAYEKFYVDTEQISGSISSAMGNMAMAVVDTFGQMIEAMAASEDFDFGASLLGAVGGFMKQLGEAMISIGVIGKLFDTAIKSMQWYLALGAGVALVAAGALLSGVAKRGVGMAEGGVVPGGYPGDTYPAMLTSGETVIPPHKLDMMGGATEVYGTIRGQDIYLSNQRHTSKRQRYT